MTKMLTRINMLDDLLFISYSRNELYFAESLTLALQKKGLKVWFDLQQLEPGCDWQKEIRLGLETCQGLILIVSEASLNSPYVYLEWKTALEQGKQIYLAIFEPVNLAPRKMKSNEEEILVDFAPLIEKASAIVDMRSRFDAKTELLYQAIIGSKQPCEAIAEPNQWRITTKMPLATAFVLASMLLLTLSSAAISFLYFQVSLPILLFGILLTAWLGWQSLAFARRESYQGTRVALAAAPFIMLLFFPMLSPVFLIAALLAFLSPDSHRSSPLGQGLRRAIQARVNERKRIANSWVEKLANYYSKTVFLRFVLIFMALVSGLLALLVIAGVFMNPDTSSLSTVVFCLTPTVLFGAPVLIFGRMSRRMKDQNYGIAPQTGVSFKVLAEPFDKDSIGREVEKVMLDAGHQQVMPEEEAKFTLVILSDKTSNEFLAKLDTKSQGYIFILGSWLSKEAAARFKNFSHFQWVDYRQQRRLVLEGLAEDLLHQGQKIISYSYGTRILPQSFARLILPGTVANYVTLQFLSFNLYIVTSLSQGSEANDFGFLGLFEGLIVHLLGIWVINRVIRREITITWILVINLAIGIGFTLFFSLWTFSQLGLLNSQFDSGLLLNFMTPSLIALGFSLLLLRYNLQASLASWLPKTMTGFPPFPRLLEDKDLWLRNFFTAALVALLTIAFFGLPGDTNAPIVDVLAAAPGLFNAQLIALIAGMR
jgi:hypothetical protein